MCLRMLFGAVIMVQARFQVTRVSLDSRALGYYKEHQHVPTYTILVANVNLTFVIVSQREHELLFYYYCYLLMLIVIIHCY